MTLEGGYPETTLFACNLPFGMPPAELARLFPNQPRLLGASFPTGSHFRWFGFVAYETRELCQEVIDYFTN
jgi:hypothetical protein